MTGSDFLEQHSEFLVDFEKKEILKYPTIYYLNIVERRKEEGMPKQDGKTNDGWSMDNGYFDKVILL
jgi:hypothetical protein